MPAPYPISLLANSSNNSWPPIPLFPGSLPGQPPTLTPGNSPLSSLQFPRALITPSRTPVSSFSPFSKLLSPKWQSWCLVMFNVGSPNVTGPGTEHSVNVCWKNELFSSTCLRATSPEDVSSQRLYASVLPREEIISAISGWVQDFITSQASSFRRDRRLLLDAWETWLSTEVYQSQEGCKLTKAVKERALRA